MTALRHGKQRVRATYSDGEIQFDIPETTTLEQIAGRLAAFANGRGKPVSVEIGISIDRITETVSCVGTELPDWAKVY